MPIEGCTCYEVFIASPSDCHRERVLASRAILDWNLKYTANTQRVLLPRKWETDMIRMGGPDGIQPVINADLVDPADLLIVFLKRSLGDSGGTEREIERFLELGYHHRVTIYARNGGRDADERLTKYLDDTLKPILVITPYGSWRDVEPLVQNHLWRRICVTLAKPYLSSLRDALRTNTRLWSALSRAEPDAPAKAFLILVSVDQALKLFLTRQAGRPLPIVDNPARQARSQLEPLIQDRDEFIAATPFDDSDDAVSFIQVILSALPAEETLL